MAQNPRDVNSVLSADILDDFSELTGKDIAKADYSPNEEESLKLFRSLLRPADHDSVVDVFNRYINVGLLRRGRPDMGVRKCESTKDKKRIGSLKSRERRTLGLHKINKFDKTFEMFLPINKMWKAYAKKHFCISDDSSKHTESLANSVQINVRKLEYFGCLMRVSRSVCSEYIGVVGIVIRETKNTFMLICPDDKVKTIPKKHSEFSFVVEKFGITVLGNHLNIKPAVRAKHAFKKHCIWL
ncbi:ribonuclease P protein subunit p29 [Palaemon carinicauda]|uniref:ribonuclease P protein subunit p29 n=1 Tax=Palaemon carinicauda TaxID=392227 RepID=UPI0035B5D55D